MILERLIFENFRQFKGRQELVFSTLREQNVTIVHAENGFGKTTILMGLLWGLYGRDGLIGANGKPEDFEKPDRLVTECVAAQARDPNKVEAAVELCFKHEGDRYILRRSITLAQQRLNPKKTELSLIQIRDGESFSPDNPQRRIHAILPEGIRRLVFFHGERINNLAKEHNSDEVASAIRQMLGLELLSTTIADLNHPNVKGKLRQEQREQPTTDEMAALLDEQESLEEELVGLEEKKEQIQRNIEALEEEVELIDKSLEANKEAREVAVKRARLNKELGELRTRRAEVSRKLAKLIAEDGYILFTTDLVSKGQEIVARLRAEGKIPARVLNSFLQDLLDSERCICTRDLSPGTEFRAAVEKLMEIAGDAEFNNAVGALDHAIGVLEEGSRKTEEQIRELNKERLQLTSDIANLDDEIEGISQQIGKDSEEAHDLEERRRTLLLNRDSQNAEFGRTEGKIDHTRGKLDRVKTRINQMEKIGASAELARRRVAAVEDCTDILQRILEAETEDLRPLLNEEISRHFRKIIDRDFWPELADDFTLRIRKRVAGAVVDSNEAEIDAALSTGQRIVTALVFIASLVALASLRAKIPTIIRGLSGSDYPIAIDSPFAPLSMFRKEVARYIPELAPQVVLLVSPSQYDGDVHEALESVGRIGKRYYLSFTGPTIREDANPDLVIGGEKFQQYYPSRDEEFTTICEL